MNKKLIVLANWATPIEKTWSGTTYSITKALSNYYQIETRDLKRGRLLNLLNRLSTQPIIGYICGKLFDSLMQLKANWILRKDKGVPVLEIPDDIILKNNPYYIYADMSYAAGIQLKEENRSKSWIYPAAQNNMKNQAELHRRKESQKKRYQSAAGILFMSNWVLLITKKKFQKITTSMNHVGGGTNMDFTQVSYEYKTGKRFLFIGRDFERKAGDLVIKAFKLLHAKQSDLELYIAGPRYNPAPNVPGISFFGDTDFKETQRLFNACDVFVMPSRFEAYGLVFVEALIYGLPCIGRQHFEMPYFIQKGVNGELIEEDNVVELSQKMESVLFNKVMIENVRKNKELYIKQYTWEAVAKRIRLIIN